MAPPQFGAPPAPGFGAPPQQQFAGGEPPIPPSGSYSAPGQPQAGYPTGFTPGPVAQKESNGLAVAALVVGISSLVLLFLCGLGAITGLAAVVLGVLGLSASKKSPTGAFRGQAIWGIVTGAVAMAIGVVVIALVFVVGSTADDVNSDPSDGFCDQSRFVQDPDC